MKDYHHRPRRRYDMPIEMYGSFVLPLVAYALQVRQWTLVLLEGDGDTLSFVIAYGQWLSACSMIVLHN